MCYVWNDKTYKLALTLINFQGGTKPTNYNSSCAMGQLYNYYKLLTDSGVTFIPFKG